MSQGSQPPYQPDSRGRINTESSTRSQAFNTAKDVNSIPRSQSPDRQYKVTDKETNAELRQWDYTNNRGEDITIREDKPKQYPDGGQQGSHFNVGDAGSKLSRQHHYYEKK